MTKTLCIHQFIRPEGKQLTWGVGDCTICKPDEKNKECKCYYPIKISVFSMPTEQKLNET
jgi:hypothetical protein